LVTPGQREISQSISYRDQLLLFALFVTRPTATTSVNCNPWGESRGKFFQSFIRDSCAAR
jgi:hypothetical protein